MDIRWEIKKKEEFHVQSEASCIEESEQEVEKGLGRS